MGLFGKYDVFLSYRSLDAHLAREIADQLIASRIRVWFAEYQILISNWERFEQAIVDGIQRSKFGLAITNNRYAESKYCRLEMRRLIEHIGPERVLEVSLPEEDDPHRLFPELAYSPHLGLRDNAEIPTFVQAHTGWNIRPVFEIGRAVCRRQVEGICLGERYRLDVTGWEVVDPRGYRHPGGMVDGPMLRYSNGKYPIHVNMIAGPETAPVARRQDRTADDREMYDILRRHVPYHVGQLGAKLHGVHLLFHHDLSQMAVTYTMRGYWTRKHSIILPHPSHGQPAEFLFTFGFPGPFQEYCRHVRIMDSLVATLAWGE